MSGESVVRHAEETPTPARCREEANMQLPVDALPSLTLPDRRAAHFSHFTMSAKTSPNSNLSAMTTINTDTGSPYRGSKHGERFVGGYSLSTPNFVLDIGMPDEYRAAPGSFSPFVPAEVWEATLLY